MTVFTYVPDYPPTATRKPRVKSIQFGDGYEQRSPDGINTLPEIWDVQFNNRESTEIDDIEAFLSALNGVDYFQWTPPRSATQANYICRQWQRTAVKGNLDSLTATFEQVFDL